MVEQDFLVLIVEKLNQLQIPYMVTGSIAVSYYGHPRATHDIDVVLQIHQLDIVKIQKAFANDFYISDIEHAIRHRQMFNLIHQQSQLKVDCWVMDNTNKYGVVAFSRRRSFELFNKKVWFISIEDLIIAKLLWYKEAPSDIHLNDVKGVVLIQNSNIDNEYLDKWSKQVSVNELWMQIKNNLKL